MKSIGLIISHKENEKRRALVPEDIKLLKHPEFIYIEDGYGQVLGFSNDDYSKYGIKVCDRTEVLTKDVICDPKIGDADYLNLLYEQTIFGWVHAVQNRGITDNIIESKLSCFAWEDMFEGGRHCFWRNNEIAGEAAVFHAYMCHGVFPYHTKAAVLGKGNIARGAIKTLNYLGADVVQYDRKTERLFQKELGEYNVIVNCTPCGMYPRTDECPKLPYEAMDSHTILYDLIYNPDETMFMKRGAAYGANTKNGLEMLLLQAFASWEFWNSTE